MAFTSLIRCSDWTRIDNSCGRVPCGAGGGKEFYVMLNSVKHLCIMGKRSFTSFRMTVGVSFLCHAEQREASLYMGKRPFTAFRVTVGVRVLCHAEQREASLYNGKEILHFVQDDSGYKFFTDGTN